MSYSLLLLLRKRVESVPSRERDTVSRALSGPFFLKFSILKISTLELLNLALVLKTLWQSEKHVLICRHSLFPGETLKGVWLIVVYYTDSNFLRAQHPPSFNQSNIPFISDKAYTIKTGYLELHIKILAPKKDLLFNKVLCFACCFLRNECFRVYKYRNFILLSYDISCTSPAI